MISNICTTGVGAADEVEVNPLNAVFFFFSNKQTQRGEKDDRPAPVLVSF